MGNAARFHAGFQIAQRIADGGHAVQAGMKAHGDVPSNMPVSGLRHGSSARRCRAEENRVDTAALAKHLAAHLVVDGIERRHVEQAASDARLVGGHNHAIAVLVRAIALMEPESVSTVRRLDECSESMVDDAVATGDDD